MTLAILIKNVNLFIRNPNSQNIFSNVLVNSQFQAIVVSGILRHLGIVQYIFNKHFTKCLLYTRYSSKHFSNINSFNPNNSL